MTVLPERGRPRAQDIQTWAMWIHFSQFAGIFIPFAGLIVPVILWQAKRGEFPDLDPHGKAVTNWVLSLVLYGFVCLILSFGLIGIPLLLALGIVGVVFPVIGGIKANMGEAWKYPLAIPFLK
ncbi:MAG: DUF4870 domain-containing protein [Nitrospirota bacterium]|nr:DUF4870 domain-containing protein [Nitrospirota bacterium]